ITETRHKEFKTKRFGPYEWLDDGNAYTMMEEVDDEPSTETGDDEQEADPAKAMIKVQTDSGQREVLVSVDQLTPAGADEPLSVDDYDWSSDKRKLLIFTNTVKVWRRNTRGDYWVLDLDQDTLRRVGAGASPSTLMFAKFSPDGTRVAYVRDHNIYVEDLQTGETVQLTHDGDTKLINGTFDWVYEEELDLRDGFRWSPDGTKIAYWQLDSDGIEDFYMINNTDELYPTLIPLPYPKVGTVNSACRIGVVDTEGGDTLWMDIPGDPRNNYLASLEWVADDQHVLVEQLNRLQNHRQLWQANVDDGTAEVVFEDRDDAWIDVRHKFDWYESDTHRLVLSEQDGWRHVYRIGLADHDVALLTPGDYDVIDLVGMDREAGWLYFTASPEDPIRRYLYRVPLAGGPPTRVTPDGEPGQHTYDVAPNGKWAIHTYSAMGVPPRIELIELPSHETRRVLEDNQACVDALAKLRLGQHEFFRVGIADDENDPSSKRLMDGWIIKPPEFDPQKKYPILFYVYSEPWGQTARDVWGGNRYLWHLLLSQRGYLVATVENRGTPAPRGRDWRKAIYRKIGIVNVADQAAGAREILQWPFVDDRRVGVWGWSGGGSMTLNAMFQHPELYHVGMSIAPVGDQRLYDTIYQERYMGLPEDNDEGFTQGSPVHHAEKLEGDLLLVHGTGDDNVHYQNAEVVINALIESKRPFDMMSYPNRSHGISEGENTSEHLFSLLTRYLTDHLPAGPQ
ncbi:MAG: S9 family peptidase, partial [Planctomycetota bacterium]